MTGDLPPSFDEMRDPPGSPPLANIRADMAKIFGAPGRATAPRTPKTIAVAVGGAATQSPPIRHRIAIGPMIAAAAAGLLIGIAAIGGLYLTDVRNRSIPMAAAPATGVAVTPFEQANRLR